MRAGCETLVGTGLFDFGDRTGAFDETLLQHPLGVLWHEGLVYVADTYNNRIKVLDPAAGSSRVLAGNGESGERDGRAAEAQFNEPNDLAFLDGRFYITDTNNHLLRVYDPAGQTVSTLELSGLDRLQPAGRSTIARRFELAPRRVSDRLRELTLRIDLGEGYQLNSEAPSFLEGVSSDRRVARPGPARLEGKGRTVEISLPLELAPGQAVLELELGLYYCEAVNESRCLVEQALLRLPLTVAAEGESVLVIERGL